MTAWSASRAAVAALAALLIALSLWRLAALDGGVVARQDRVGDTPVTTYRLAGAPPGPAIIVAHGFSGSRPLMRAFAVALAQAGYTAVSFDFLGHGRHPAPMTGDVAREDGATSALVAQLAAVADYARALPDVSGGLALLGHSMAGDVIARHALAQGAAVAATVGVSMASPVVDGAGPRNLLMVVGAWEPGLTDWALRALRDAHGPQAQQGATHGDFADGSARRVAFAPRVEHIGVLWSPVAIGEATAWLDRAFGRPASPPPPARGPWVALLIGGLVALGWPLAALLPRLAAPAAPALRGWRFALSALGPAAATPLILAPLDIRLLPVAVGDYLALHFLTMGALTWLALRLLGARAAPAPILPAIAGALAVALWALGALGAALDAHVSAFLPTLARAPLILALLPGAALLFLSDERLTRAPGAPRFAYPLTKLALLISLAAAVALNPERLFFLVILTPALVLFVIVYGLFSRWAFARTGDPRVGGLATALAFAWGIGVTFPLLAA